MALGSSPGLPLSNQVIDPEQVNLKTGRAKERIIESCFGVVTGAPNVLDFQMQAWPVLKWWEIYF